jgi:hypothetical protein
MIAKVQAASGRALFLDSRKRVQLVLERYAADLSNNIKLIKVIMQIVSSFPPAYPPEPRVLLQGRTYGLLSYSLQSLYTQGLRSKSLQSKGSQSCCRFPPQR